MLKDEIESMKSELIYTLKEAVRYQLALWRAIREIEICMETDCDNLQNQIEGLCGAIDGPNEVTTELVTPVYEELLKQALENEESYNQQQGD